MKSAVKIYVYPRAKWSFARYSDSRPTIKEPLYLIPRSNYLSSIHPSPTPSTAIEEKSLRHRNDKFEECYKNFHISVLTFNHNEINQLITNSIKLTIIHNPMSPNPSNFKPRPLTPALHIISPHFPRYNNIDLFAPFYHYFFPINH